MQNQLLPEFNEAWGDGVKIEWLRTYRTIMELGVCGATWPGRTISTMAEVDRAITALSNNARRKN